MVPPPLEFAGSVLYHYRSADQGRSLLIGNDAADRGRLAVQRDAPAANDRGEQQLGQDAEIFSHDVVCIKFKVAVYSGSDVSGRRAVLLPGSVFFSFGLFLVFYRLFYCIVVSRR